ncbi:glyoxalase family protein [Vibrio ishigakensis]|uniref:Glyoxalase family protein n=1 Tax=Vibrio ishigakensis TaxID=1481914 RepID=A0A0B8PEZ6_9VIBR|nr:VOC family protein [Vibrio ishigakensis]GAM58139.1 glyoxalase family protein [Vibrio ishigakensis]GAM61384.1 glyoxalase family protein [Vibrio ishigakensis]
MTKLEHANITVPSIDAAIEFLGVVAPDFRVRADKFNQASEYRWAHIGNDENYIALQEPKDIEEAKDARRPYFDFGVNHLALTVGDIEQSIRELVRLGYQRNGELSDEVSRKRVYFYDRAGFEWELVQYLSDDPKQRYRYDD